MSNPYPAPSSLLVKRCGTVNTAGAKRLDVDISSLGLTRTPQILVQTFCDLFPAPMVFATVVAATPESFTVELSATVDDINVHWIAIA